MKGERRRKNPWQTELKPGVYDVFGFGLPIRLIVPREVELNPRNALWHLLSGVPERIEYGLKHCELKDRELFDMLTNQLERNYSKEGIIMPITVEDYRKEWREELLAEATPEERLKGLTKEEIRDAMQALGLEKDADGDSAQSEEK